MFQTAYTLGCHGKHKAAAEADPLYQRALGIKEEILGPDRPIVAQILNELGYHINKRTLCGRDLFERALDIREKPSVQTTQMFQTALTI